jgi:asparagine synthase (glutamine-hydrolysing)
MSRIVAVFSPSGLLRVRDLCTAGLTRAASNARWTQHVVAIGPVALGWTGLGTPGAAQIGSVLVALDGRFFNRDELPHAPSDAARLILLYERYGMEASLARINGDFSFALYDAAAHRLYAGRDRFGLKPLYWARMNDGVAVASRPRALLVQPGISSTPDRAFVARFAACHYRVFDNPVERSAYADIAQVAAATFIAFAADGSAKSVKWWDLTEQPDFPLSEDELAERYRHLLMDSVRRRLDGATAPAFTLSGGLDSSSVLSCAVAATGKPQIAYSSVYKDRTFDESAEIAPMLTGRVAEWRPVALGNDIALIDLVSRMIEVHDEPVATATWLAHFVLSERVADDQHRALFGGLGGDELNAGEYEYFFFRFADLQSSGAHRELEHEIECWARHHDHPIWRKNRAIAFESVARLSDFSRAGGIRTDRARLERYWPALLRSWFDLTGYEPALDHPFTSALKNRTYQDIFRETAPCCLRAEDRHATHFGFERLDPFLDHRLVEFMFRVPGHHKIRDGITKRLLRTAMTGILPDETRLRVKKTGWNAPAHIWFTGRGLGSIRDLVASRAFRERGIYNVGEVERLIDAHAEAVADSRPRDNHMMFLWQLLNLEIWMTSL